MQMRMDNAPERASHGGPRGKGFNQKVFADILRERQELRIKRKPEKELIIRRLKETPEDNVAWSVFADLLQDTHDPQGQLITIARILEGKAPGFAGISAQRIQELEESRDNCITEAIMAFRQRFPRESVRPLEWQGGVMTKVFVADENHLEPLLESEPFIKELVLAFDTSPDTDSVLERYGIGKGQVTELDEEEEEDMRWELAERILCLLTGEGEDSPTALELFRRGASAELMVDDTDIEPWQIRGDDCDEEYLPEDTPFIFDGHLLVLGALLSDIHVVKMLLQFGTDLDGRGGITYISRTMEISGWSDLAHAAHNNQVDPDEVLALIEKHGKFSVYEYIDRKKEDGSWLDRDGEGKISDLIEEFGHDMGDIRVDRPEVQEIRNRLRGRFQPYRFIDTHNWTALMHASDYVAESMRQKRERIVDLLITYGADVNASDEHLITPLMIAASAGNPNIVELLLKGGALIDAKDDKGRTAYDYAVQAGWKEIASRLISQSDNLNRPEDS